MKKVNVKLFAIKYKLLQKLTKSLEKDKEAIKNNAELTMTKYAKIKLVECTKKSYSKEVQQELEEYAKSKGYEKQETKYTRLEIDNINEDIDHKVDEILATLEDSNDRDIKRVASKVANKR